MSRLFLLGIVLSVLSFVSSLGTSCSTPLGAGTAASGDPFWLETIKHQGTSAFSSNSSGYQVFRNVKDFGAKGDGVTDDTDAINDAMSDGNRCGEQKCASSTVTPAIVYFPKGTYLVSRPIVLWYYTQLVGDATSPPTLLAAPNFDGIAVIDVNPYTATGQWYVSQNNFFRSVRNFIIDTRQVPSSRSQGTGIHWQVSQTTSLYNIVFQLSDAADTAHQGVWIEDGSGGFMGDLTINGGKYGLWVGNQQFTVRNVVINNAQIGVFANWNWGWTFQGLTINNCKVAGFEMNSGGIGSETIIDAIVSNTPVFFRTTQPSSGKLGGSVVLNNIELTNVPTAVGVSNGDVVLTGGTKTISSWGQGNVYTGSNTSPQYVQGDIPAFNKPSVLLDEQGRIFGRGRPQYETYAPSQFVSVKDNGAKGDGRTDDTAALQAIFDKFSGCKIIFFDAGTYVVTSTLKIPAGTQMVGEAWSVIAGRGSNFQDINNPRVVVQVGDQGSQGIVEISDILFSVIGPTPGAIVVEWNVKQPNGVNGGAGMWDTHIRLGGSEGTNLQLNCPILAGTDNNCFAAFLALHLTRDSTAYLEGNWVWLADHNMDGDGSTRISLYAGRGIYSESAGPVWMVGTASEHFTLYQYQFVNAKNHYIGFAQTETPYYQPVPAAPTPFMINPAWNDPTTYDGGSAWGLRIVQSSDITVFGGGFYSFYNNDSQDCIAEVNCQRQMVTVDSASTDVHLYGISTVGTQFVISMDQNPVAKADDNQNGFAQTVTYWDRASQCHKGRINQTVF